MNPPQPPACALPWDSEFFGRRVGRIEKDRLDQTTLDEVIRWSHAHGIELLYFFARPDDLVTALLVESNGFHLVDQRITMEHALDDTEEAPDHVDEPTELLIRDWESADLAILEAMARTNHRDSRFHFDSRLPNDRCDELYATWIRNSCHGWADRVLVALIEQRPAGYLSCHLEQGTGRIGLVGVDRRLRGRGVGARLIREALRWFAAQAAKRVLVVTQGRNIAAQRLYQAQGFKTLSLSLCYHFWR